MRLLFTILFVYLGINTLVFAQNVIPNPALILAYDQGSKALSQKDYTTALNKFTFAAEQGYDRAQNDLGLMYKSGWGTDVDYKKALYWYRKAAEQENSAAQSNLGVMYENGHGVEKNYTEAHST